MSQDDNQEKKNNIFGSPFETILLIFQLSKLFINEFLWKLQFPNYFLFESIKNEFQIIHK